MGVGSWERISDPSEARLTVLAVAADADAKKMLPRVRMLMQLGG
jgi:hypothetical protein